MIPVLVCLQLHFSLPLLLRVVASLQFVLSLDYVEEFAALDFLAGEILRVVHAVDFCMLDFW